MGELNNNIKKNVGIESKYYQESNGYAAHDCW